MTIMLLESADALDDRIPRDSRGRGIVLSEQADAAGLGFARTTDNVLAVGVGGIGDERTAEDVAGVTVRKREVRVGYQVEAVFPAGGHGAAFGGPAAVDAERSDLEGERCEEEEEESGEGEDGLHAVVGVGMLWEWDERSVVDGPALR